MKIKHSLLDDIFYSQELKSILSQLLTNGPKTKIYLVGGALRDYLLKRTPNDFDFAISGNGIEFARKFALKTKSAFVLLSEKDDEARVVLPNGIIFDFNGLGDKTIREDLLRRDFTINALALDLHKPTKIIDKFHGLTHLKSKIIFPTTNKSLILDPLRILRAFRIALELNFTVSNKVFELTKNINLSAVAPERIGYELLRICESAKSYRSLKILHDLNVLAQLFPLAKRLFDDKKLFAHSLRTYKKIESLLSRKSYFSQFTDEFAQYFNNFPFRRALLKIAGLFHDIAKPHTEFKTPAGDVHFYGHDNLGAKMVSRLAYENLRLSRKQTLMLKKLVANHMRLHLLATAPELTDRAIRRFFRDVDDEYFGLMILTYADGYATAKMTKHLEITFDRMLKLKQADAAKKKVLRLINGDDLIVWGYKPGPIFKIILQELEELQLEGKITTKEEGYEYLRNNYPLNSTI